MELKQYLEVIQDFLRNYLIENHQDGYVLGLSGGVDSSLVSVLTQKAVGNDKLMCIMIPIESREEDLKDALELANKFKLNYKIIDATKTYQTEVAQLKEAGIELNTATKSNLKVRIRMTILYAYAQMHRSLVVGTDNADEMYVGYFTKYGDGGVDLLPIVYLTKSEVVEASKMLGIPNNLAERVPTAGLFEGQTDEGEMGIKYKDLDTYVLGGEIDPVSKARIDRLHSISEHKRKPISRPIPFDRTSN